ncbi:MAG: dTDP-4-dehydrorhamnose reductase [Oscillospiraceae bacterium]|nr:dTDP-4-dehydrorhamnose reductase [Oscillospiraceae bacterium]
MNVLVTGVKGQLGYDVCKRLDALGISYKGVDIEDCDLTKREQVLALVEGYRPDAVIHCAAYTAVDKAEDNRELVTAVNVGGTRNVAEACKAVGAKMVYISTDYVFDGSGAQEWKPDDARCPVNFYGLSKAQGEDAVRETLDRHFIVRITWAFGINGNNIIKTVLRLGKEREELSFVTDQIASPTYTADLAVLLCDMIQTDQYGTYHATNEGYCSSCELACAILKEAGITTCRISPILTADYPSRAARPLNSRLSKDKLEEAGFRRLPSWQDALHRFVQEFESRT